MKHLLIAAALLVTANVDAKEYLVKYKDAKTFSTLNTMASMRSAGFTTMSQHKAGSYIKINVSEKRELQTLAEIMARPGVQWVVPNGKLHSFSAPVDTTALRAQWAVTKVNAEKAWQIAGNKGSRKVVVAVIDTGVDYNHKNLAPNIVEGFDFINNNNKPMDITGSSNPGHGTHCAGVVGASGLVEGGTIGLSPEVSIMPLRFLDENGSGDFDNGVKSIDYAISKGVNVISASWGAQVSASQVAPLLEALKRADDAGIIFVAAAGNGDQLGRGLNNDSNDFFPTNADLPNMISVAASDQNDAKTSFSNFGTGKVHVASPGLGIVSTIPKDKYMEMDGTSMATPLVAGLVALLKAQDMSLTGAQIRAILQTTGAKTNIEIACHCRVDAAAAVEFVKNKNMLIYPAAATIAEAGTAQVKVLNAKAPVTFTSRDPAIMTVNDQGVVTAVAKGTTTISAVDADGKSVNTLDFTVGKASGGTDPGEPGEPGECPLGNPALCEMLCGIMPDLPFCKK